MKTLFTLIIGVFGFIQITIGQDAVEKKTSMSLGPQNAFYIEIPGADTKVAEKLFYQKMKEFGKMKENRKAREHFAMATKIPVINGTSPIDVYAKFEDGKDMATTYVWVDLGGSFVSSTEHKAQSVALNRFLYDYFIDVRKVVVEEELKKEEKALTSLEKELKKLKDKNDDYHNDIEKAKQKILDAEKNIENNIQDQENKDKEIETQKVVIDTVKDKLNNLGKRD